MMNKQYDWFATRIFQPELSLDELFDQGITPENTGFKTREDYKNMTSVRDQFRNAEGGFDEDSFNRAYDSSREMYNLYVNREYSKKLLEEYAHDPYEWYTPATEEIIDVSASNVPTKNGMFYSTNIAGIGEETESPQSVREIAQSQLVHDENGNELDWTPEDKGGLLKGLVRDPLVLATYDFDTPEYDENGNLIGIHKKGEYKLNKWGAPYYEKLGDRDAYGKEMLHYSDTFTKEGTVLNKLDFYDSDDKKKSVFGTAMKTAAQIVPMFVHPAVGYTWGAINAAKGIGQSLAALGKGIDSIITGSDENEFGRNLTKLENWLARFDNSKSDYGQTHMWASAETYGDLIGSTTKQLFEQRLIANIPKQLTFLGPKIKRSKLGQDMAIAYMAATSAKESYQAGIEAGLGDRQAGLLLLANTAAMWKLMDSDYGRSTLFKGSWFDDDMAKKTARETADQMVKSTDSRVSQETITKHLSEYGTTRAIVVDKVDDAAEGLSKSLSKGGAKGTKNGPKPKNKPDTKPNTKPDKPDAQPNTNNDTEVKDNVLTKGLSTIEASKKFLSDAYETFSKNLKNKLELFKGAVDMDEYLAAMRNEAFEEVIEEGISDITKATTLALEALGVKMNDTGEKLDYGFSGKDIFDRYLLSFIGGAVGGGIFRGYSAVERLRDNGWERVNPDYQRELVHLIADGKADEVIEEYRRLYKKGLLGSTVLENTNFKMSEDSVADVAGPANMSQADANLQILIGNVEFIKQILNNEGIFDALKKSKSGEILQLREAIWSNDELTEKEKRGEFLLRFQGSNQLMTSDFLKLANDFVIANEWKKGTIDPLASKDNLTEDEQNQLNEARTVYEQRIKELRQQRDDILSGKFNGHYISSMLLEVEGILPKLLYAGKLDKDAWALSMYGQSYQSLHPLYQMQVDKDMDLYFKDGVTFYGKNFAKTHLGTKRAFLFLQKWLKPELEKQNDRLKDVKINEFYSDNYFGEEYFRLLDAEVILNENLAKEMYKKQRYLQSNKNPDPAIIKQYDDNIASLRKNLNEIIKKQKLYRHKDGDPSTSNDQNFVPRSMLLQRFKADDGKMQKLIDTYYESIKADKTNEAAVFSSLISQIRDIYKEIQKDNGLVQDFGEFEMAKNAILDYIKRLRSRLFVFDGLYDAALSETSLSVHELNNTFKEALADVESAIEEGEYAKAKTMYARMQKVVTDVVAEFRKPEFEEIWEETEMADEMDVNGLIEHTLNGAFYFPNLAFGNSFENPFDSFFDITEIIGTLNKSPFAELLNGFHRMTDDKDAINATNYIENLFSKYKSTKDWREFFIANPADQKLLQQLIVTIDLIETLISTDAKTAELLNSVLSEEDRLVIFNPIAKRNILKDLDTLKNKIYTVWKNGIHNANNRHGEIEKGFQSTMINKVQNLLKFWGDIEDDEFNIKAIWKDVIADSSLKQELENIEGISLNSITGEQFNEFYARIRNFEAKVFNVWATLTKDLNDDQKVQRFFKLFEKHPAYELILLNKETNPYDKRDKGAITPVETFKYLLELITLSSVDFDDAYKHVLKAFAPTESHTPPIPNDEQENANRMLASWLSNPAFWAAIRLEMQKRVKEHKWSKENEVQAGIIGEHYVSKNMIIVPGAGGVGKTTMVGLITDFLWGEDNVTKLYAAPMEETAKGLASTFGETDDKKIFKNKLELFQFLFGKDANLDFKIEVKNKVLKLKERPKFLNPSKEHIATIKESADVLIIDEIGQYTEIELMLIDEIAAKAGIHVIGLGDHCQIGSLATFGEGKNTRRENSNYKEIEVWSTPYMTRTMRDTSVAKGTNNEKLGKAIYTIENVLDKTEGDLNELIKKGIVDGVSIKTDLIYSALLTSGICGDRITKDKAEFDKIVKHIINTKHKKDRISIVVDSDEKIALWTDLMKKSNLTQNTDFIIKDIRKNQINGYETTYTIVDVNWDPRIKSSAKTAWKEFYTISQRSHNATIFFDANDSLKNIHITSSYHKDAARVWANNVEFVKKWYETRMKWLTGNGTTVLFDHNPTSFINHSGGAEDKKKKKEVSVPSVKPLDDGPKRPKKDDSEKPTPAEIKEESDKKELKRKIDEAETKINDVIADIKKSFFIESDGTFKSSVYSDISALTSDDVLKAMSLVNSLINKVEATETAISKDDKVIDGINSSLLSSLGDYKKGLLNFKTQLNQRSSEIEHDDNVVAEHIKQNLEKLVDPDSFTTTSQKINVAEENLRLITDEIEPNLSKLTEESANKIFGKSLAEVEQQIQLAKKDLTAKLDAFKENLDLLRNDFEIMHPEIIDSDVFSLSSVNDDTDIAEIDKVINEYHEKINELSTITDEGLKDLVESKKSEWETRIAALENMKKSLEESSEEPSEESEMFSSNVDLVDKLDEDLRTLWQQAITITDVDKRLKTIRDVGTKMKEIVAFAKTVLAEDLTEDDRKYVEEIIQYWQKRIDENPSFYKVTVEEHTTNSETINPRGFTINQTTSPDAELDIDETTRIINNEISDVEVMSLFGDRSKKIYEDLLNKTAEREVIIWGLDLETTGLGQQSGIVQLGLVEYKLTRNAKGEWVVTKGESISKFVTPNNEVLDNNEPPQLLNGKTNPIYQPWIDAEASRISEAKALDMIASKTKSADYILTYNGNDFDMRVLRNRASVCRTDLADFFEKQHIDIYADFIVDGKTRNFLWRNKGGRPRTIRGLLNYKLETVSSAINKVLTVGPAHDAESDVNATMNILVNIFNGLPIYKQEHKRIRSEYEKTFMGDDLYLNLLKNYAEEHHEEFETSVEELYKFSLNTRWDILNGRMKVEMRWIYNDDPINPRSKLVCSFEDANGNEFEDFPLLEVAGKHTDEFTGTFKRRELMFAYNGKDDISLTELLKAKPTLRFSKPFVLTGLKYNETAPASDLSEGASWFYNPETTNQNLGKTFVLVVDDPNVEQNWDPEEELISRIVNGKIDWRNTKYKMLTVSRDADLQEMIDFAIATCCFATDVVNKQFMSDYFKSLKEDRVGDETIIIGGVTIARSEYENLMEGKNLRDRLKLFYSNLFSVMDDKVVGRFLASLVNASVMHPEVKDKLSEGLNKKDLHQWLFENLLESVKRVPYNLSSWGRNKNIYESYYFLDLKVNGKAYKLVYNSDATSTEGFYLFEDAPNIDLKQKVQDMSKAKSKSINDGGIVISGNSSNQFLDIINALCEHLGVLSINDLDFGNISLMSESHVTGNLELRVFPVSSNEVFTRTFTTWTGEGTLPARVSGWNEVFNYLSEQLKGFTHGIYGHEIIGTYSNGGGASTIFTPSLCNNCLNGEYKARGTILIDYGGWEIHEDVQKVEVFKQNVQDRISWIKDSGFQQFVEQELDIEALARSEYNLNLSPNDLTDILIVKFNELAEQYYAKEDVIQTFSFTPDKGFIGVTRFKTAEELPEEMVKYNKDYYWIDSDGKQRAHILFDKEGKPVEFRVTNIENIDKVYTCSLESPNWKVSLFKNILLSLWDKKFKVNDRERNYLGYFMTYVKNDGNIADSIKQSITKSILDLSPEYFDQIFTQEIIDGIKQFDEDVYDAITSGISFEDAFEDAGYTVFTLIDELC